MRDLSALREQTLAEARECGIHIIQRDRSDSMVQLKIWWNPVGTLEGGEVLIGPKYPGSIWGEVYVFVTDKASEIRDQKMQWGRWEELT